MRLPLWVEVSGRRVIVVGGGGVGTRRALWFARAGAKVTVVALQFSEQLRKAASEGLVELVELDVLRDAGRLERLLADADIVVIATDNPQVNSLVWSLARKHRLWVNDATDAERTQLVVPYVGEAFSGAIKIAVTSEGRSGVAARHARDYLVKCLEESTLIRNLYKVMASVKKALKELESNPKKRIPVYFKVEEALLGGERDALENGDTQRLLRRASEVIAKTLNADQKLVEEKLREALETLGF